MKLPSGFDAANEAVCCGSIPGMDVGVKKRFPVSIEGLVELDRYIKAIAVEGQPFDIELGAEFLKLHANVIF